MVHLTTTSQAAKAASSAGVAAVTATFDAAPGNSSVVPSSPASTPMTAGSGS